MKNANRPDTSTGAEELSPHPVVIHTRVVTETGGGPEKTILNSPRFLKPLGIHAICAYMHPPHDPGFDAIRERAQEHAARLLSLPDRGAWDLSLIRRLLKICRVENVTIWHAHDYKSNILGLILKQFYPMKLVTTVHGWVRHTRRTPLYYWLDRRCLPYYDQVICVSKDLHSECLRSGVQPERATLVHNAIDIDAFHRRRSHQEAKQALGIPANRLVIGAVGRLSAEKGFDRLIRATKQLTHEGLPVHTVIVGEGSHRNDLELLIQQLGMAPHVQLVGFHSDVKQYFEAMDMYALTSIREGLPNVVLEAMAMEVPVVATRVAGIPSLLTHEKNGFVIDIADDVALVENLRRLATGDKLRATLSRNAKKTIDDGFSFQMRMERIRDIYESLL